MAQAKADAPAAEMTASQENAVASAQDYLDFSAFSKKGLQEQLVFEDYSAKDAQYAVNHVDVDWNQQAVASATDYLDMSSFSKQALIEQLEFEGFTTAQATYGANQACK